LAEDLAPAEQVKDRRRFLELFLGTGIVASIISFLYPAFRYMIPPKTEELAADTVLAGRVGELKPNTGKIFRFGSRPGLLILSSDGTYHATSAVCTHLNCTVQYRPDLRGIWCACHNGVYSVDGRNVSGPPPKPLESYQVLIKADQIFVRRA
jgi:Rieske Fe-S protein